MRRKCFPFHDSKVDHATTLVPHISDSSATCLMLLLLQWIQQTNQLAHEDAGGIWLDTPIHLWKRLELHIVKKETEFFCCDIIRWSGPIELIPLWVLNHIKVLFFGWGKNEISLHLYSAPRNSFVTTFWRELYSLCGLSMLRFFNSLFSTTKKWYAKGVSFYQTLFRDTIHVSGPGPVGCMNFLKSGKMLVDWLFVPNSWFIGTHILDSVEFAKQLWADNVVVELPHQCKTAPSKS